MILPPPSLCNHSFPDSPTCRPGVAAPRKPIQIGAIGELVFQGGVETGACSKRNKRRKGVSGSDGWGATLGLCTSWHSQINTASLEQRLGREAFHQEWGASTETPKMHPPVEQKRCSWEEARRERRAGTRRGAAFGL